GPRVAGWPGGAGLVAAGSGAAVEWVGGIAGGSFASVGVLGSTGAGRPLPVVRRLPLGDVVATGPAAPRRGRGERGGGRQLVSSRTKGVRSGRRHLAWLVGRRGARRGGLGGRPGPGESAESLAGPWSGRRRRRRGPTGGVQRVLAVRQKCWRGTGRD